MASRAGMCICVDGIISSGKSTIIKCLKACHPEYHYVGELLHEFTSFTTQSGNVISPLKILYENNHESTAFQLYVLDIFNSVLTKLENELDNTITTPIVLDRCILSAHVFARTLYKQWFIQPFSYEY